MRISLEYFKKFDWILVGSAVALTCFGLAAIWSTSLAKHDFSNLQKQLVFFIVGLALMFGVSLFDYRILRTNSYLILTLYFLSLVLLAGTLFLGPTIGGSKRWYRIGFLSFDPLEPAKIILIILLAKYFSMRHVEMYKLRHIFISGVYVFLMAIVVFMRPSLGGALILAVVWLGVLMVSGIKLRHFFILLLCFLIITGMAWQFVLKDYQKSRVISFIFPHDTLGTAWSQSQAEIAIGSGRIFGQGMGKGSQVQYGFLPEPHTDFVFSVIAHEWGMAGVASFLILYLALIWRIIVIAAQGQSNFPRLFAAGVAIVFIAQCAINVGMNLSLLPVVGIYLPFVSYGGSGLIANFVSLGILQSINMRR